MTWTVQTTGAALTFSRDPVRIREQCEVGRRRERHTEPRLGWNALREAPGAGQHPNVIVGCHTGRRQKVSSREMRNCSPRWQTPARHTIGTNHRAVKRKPATRGLGCRAGNRHRAGDGKRRWLEAPALAIGLPEILTHRQEARFARD